MKCSCVFPLAIIFINLFTVYKGAARDFEDLKNHISDTLKRQFEQTQNEAGQHIKIIPHDYDRFPRKKMKSQKSYDDLLELDTSEGKATAIEPANKTQPVKKIEREEQFNMIDNFIKLNPKIEPDIDQKFEYEDISVSSIKEDEDLFTETLAKIYVKQGNLSKAVFAYEKLILKYPEKKAYFASQIENIKNKINR